MKTYTHEWTGHKAVYINNKAGFCKLSIYNEGDRRVATLYDLIVYPEWRGKGIGNQLLSKALSVAKFHGCSVVLLWPDCEKWVKDWYGRNGFELDDNFKNYDGEPAFRKKM